MAFSARARLVNPRLGTYFGIFASLFASLFLLVLVLEQLQLDDARLRLALFIAPLLIYMIIGLATATSDTLGYFAAGRRVPAGYTGLLLGISALGATFIVTGSGAFFFAGFDALVLLMGVLSGFVMMAIALAPFYRKFGAFTVASYLGRRFESKGLRIVAAIISVVPMLLVLSAELHLGVVMAQRLTGLAPGLLISLLVATIVVCCAPGGKRSYTWTGVAQALAVFLALLTVATVVSVLTTSLPIPQLANGPMVRGLVRNEVTQGLPAVSVWPLAFGLPDEGMAVLSKPYTQPFGAIGRIGFLMGTIAIATGIAAAPWLLPRVAATPSVYEARKALGWATLFAGLALLTISSIAVFLRDGVLDIVMSDRIGPLPPWLFDAANAGYAAFDSAATRLSFDAIRFDRDSVLFMLPVAMGLPQAFAYLLMAGGVAAALATASATIVSLAAVLSEDVVQGLSWEPGPRDGRVWTMRAFVAVAAVCGAMLTIMAPTDPLRLVLWALSITGASLFSVMILSIWWKRLTPLGATTGIIGGLATAALAIFASEAGIIGLPSAVAGIIGLPVSLALSLALSVMFPETSRHTLEVVRDIRVPGGEIIYDREMKRLQLRRQAKS